jgi:glycosyltransferase involved in cell wall biosynthesis
MVVHAEYPHDVRVAREVRVAVEDGFEVHVVATRRRGEKPREVIDDVVVHRLPILHRRGSHPLRVLAEYLGFASLATVILVWLSLPRKFDLLQVHNPPDFLIVAALVPRRFGTRVILDVHDLSSDMFAMRFASKRWAPWAERALRRIERFACRKADAILTVHEAYRSELGRRGAPPEKSLVVLNSLDERLLPQETRKPAIEPFRIVYHGTVTSHYGVDLVLRAFAEVRDRIPEATLEVYGEGDALPQLTADAEALGVMDKLTMTGMLLPQADVLRRVQGASVGVIPNRPTQLNRFALSTKLFEYVALGIPVVSADLPTIREHFNGTELNYFRAGDFCSLADAVTAVAENFDAALERAHQARRRYNESYRWTIQARRYSGVLRQLLCSEDDRPGRVAENE